MYCIVDIPVLLDFFDIPKGYSLYCWIFRKDIPYIVGFSERIFLVVVMSIWVHLFRWIFPVLLDIPCFISFHFNRIVSLCPTTSEPVVLLTSIYLVCAAAHGTPCNRGKCFSPVIFCICLCLFKSLPMNIFVHFLLHYSVSCTIRAGPILQFIGEIKIMKSSCYVFWDAFL